MNLFYNLFALVIAFFVIILWYALISKLSEVGAGGGKGIRSKVRVVLTNERVGFWIKVICGMAVVLLVFLLFISPSKYLITFVIALVIIGILFTSFEMYRHATKTNSRPITFKPKRYSRPVPDEPKPHLGPAPGPAMSVDNDLDGLTLSPVWDWESFRGVLIQLARKGGGYYIPASRRPDCVSLDGLQTTFIELRQFSAQRQGRETSRSVFVDRDRSCLVISGKTHIGSSRQVKIDMEPEPGRKMAQIPVLTIHVHPSKGSADGLSDIDYVSFLSDPRLIVMMICIQDGIIFAMKTTATPKSIAPETAQRMISTIRNDIIKFWTNLNQSHAILAFNKAVCTEFGMTLYQTTDAGENVARRIEVTNP